MTAWIDRIHWGEVSTQLDAEGYALCPGAVPDGDRRALVELLRAAPEASRRVALADAGWGQGELVVFNAALPEPLASWRRHFYGHLAPIANRWNQRLGVEDRYPAEPGGPVPQGQGPWGASHLSRLGEGGHLGLHPGASAFPLQLVAVLTRPGLDFEGGEFVMVEQRPRMQSRPIVVPLQTGDIAVVCSGTRPVAGGQGDYRVQLKQAISRVRAGERIGLSLSFHGQA